MFRLAFGVEIGDDFEGGVALDEGYFHVQGAEVYAEDGFGGCTRKGCSEEQEGVQDFHCNVIGAAMEAV